MHARTLATKNPPWKIMNAPADRRFERQTAASYCKSWSCAMPKSVRARIGRILRNDDLRHTRGVKRCYP